MSEGEVEGARQARRRWPRVLGALALGLALLLLLVWIERRPIATRFVDRELARRGVPARYTIETVGLSRQRLTNVVFGDPADPDLVADWVEVTTDVGFGGASVAGISAGRVRMRARLVDGTLRLGSLDRLMPPSSGKPFALPALDARLQDVRVRLETPQGLVGIRLSGRGRLDDGFQGQIAAFAERLDAGACRVSRMRAVAAVRIARGAPTLTGPVGINFIACGDGNTMIQGPGGQVTVTLSDRLDHWRGRAERFGAASIGRLGHGADKAYGTVTFEGDARRTVGTADIATGDFRLPGVDGGDGHVVGRFQIGDVMAFAGTVGAKGIALDRRLRAPLRGLRGQAAGTPVGPLVDRLSSALEAAAGRADLTAVVDVTQRDGRGQARVSNVELASASGVRASLIGEGLRLGWPGGGVAVRGVATVGGGGLPTLRSAIRQAAPGLAVTGTALVEPYAAATARLALGPVRFRADRRAVTLSTTATLSGPLGDGRVESVTLPIDARWTGALTFNSACTAIGWQRIAVAGLVIDPARLTLCPTGAALVTLRNGALGGGARIGPTRLTGRIGSTPLALTAGGATLRLAERGFALTGATARLGAPDRLTTIDIAALDGRIAGTVIGGRFSGARGQIGKVPLLLSDAAGTWRFAGGRLAIDGKLIVSDAAETPRFKPLAGSDVTLTLRGNAIAASGTLTTPKDGSTVADVTLAHDLARGTGSAALTLPGIVFAAKGLQPEDLTPITYGVIASVRGRLEGRGDIVWTPDRVTSTGRFRTAGTDLAAAFGPVTGIAGEIVFTDLLGLVTAPDQVATVATLNPGIPVENGTIRYRLVGGQRVQVEGGRWPFAGGELTLAPTLLDFDANQERRMTFRVTGVDAGAFLQQFDFDNLNATGSFDGVLPMVFDERGGRIEGGTLRARTGGSLAYVGTVTQEDVGFWGNLAFQALKALDYRNLDLTMDGPLAGEMVTEIRFAGVSQGAGTKSNVLIRRLAKLPFVFNITVRAPFRQLIDSVQSFYDPRRLIERNLPTLLEEQKRRAATPIQPPESEKRP